MSKYLILLSHKERLNITQIQVYYTLGSLPPLIPPFPGVYVSTPLSKSLSWGSSTASHLNTFTSRGYTSTLSLIQAKQTAVQPWQTRMPQNESDHRSAFRSTSHIKLASKQRTPACHLTMTWLMLGLPNGSQRFQLVSHIQWR